MKTVCEFNSTPSSRIEEDFVVQQVAFREFYQKAPLIPVGALVVVGASRVTR